MQRTLRLSTLVFCGLLVAAAEPWCATASATLEDMERLPLWEPYRCLTCHPVEFPSPGNSSLNPFGEDWLANGGVWDLNLANMDSDRDDCTNGFELGDDDGNGEPDGNVTRQGSNPGVQDECGGSGLVEERTWSALKALFDQR
ncbi:hypothetical protein DRQ50_00655 [bacterium]|nr:MAG: hypothetical protein DRQ50_00655 [bacterium]